MLSGRGRVLSRRSMGVSASWCFFREYRETASDGDDDDGGALLPRTPVWDSETVVWEGRAAADQRVRVASGQGEAKENNNNDINNRASVMYKGGLNERQSEGDEARQRRQEETKKAQPKVASSFLQGPVLHQVRLQRGPEIQSEAPLASRWGWAGGSVGKGGLAGLFFLGYGGRLEQVAQIFITKLFPGARLDWIGEAPCLSRPGMNEVPNRAAEACFCLLCSLDNSHRHYLSLDHDHLS